MERCSAVDSQLGALFAINGRIVGFDLFDSDVTLRKLLPKLVQSIAVDALDEKGGVAKRTASPSKKGQTQMGTVNLSTFLAAVSDSPFHAAPALGLGDDFRLTAPGLAGAALVAAGRVVHLSAFSMGRGTQSRRV